MSEQNTNEQNSTKVTETTETSALLKTDSVDMWLQEQGLETVSEEDLMGIEAEAEPEPEPEVEAKSESESESDEDEVEVESDETETDETETDEVKTETEKEKPPKGFVPIQAVQEVRSENRYLKDQIKALEEKFDKFTTQQQDLKPPENIFKVLSKEEFLELTEENPREAMAYMLDLQEHKDKQYQQLQQQQMHEQELAKTNQLFSESADLIEQAAPGIFDEGSKIQEEISNYAESIGFSDDLFFLTNPETRVILPGEQKPVFLGKQAAKVFKVIVDLRNSAADKEAKIRRQVEKELLTKFKKSKTDNFTSLSDIPSNDDEKPKNTQRLLTEKETSRLSAKELEIYLSGI
jgi:hypothetical protein